MDENAHHGVSTDQTWSAAGQSMPARRVSGWSRGSCSPPQNRVERVAADLVAQEVEHGAGATNGRRVVHRPEVAGKAAPRPLGRTSTPRLDITRAASTLGLVEGVEERLLDGGDADERALVDVPGLNAGRQPRGAAGHEVLRTLVGECEHAERVAATRRTVPLGEAGGRSPSSASAGSAGRAQQEARCDGTSAAGSGARVERQRREVADEPAGLVSLKEFDGFDLRAGGRLLYAQDAELRSAASAGSGGATTGPAWARPRSTRYVSRPEFDRLPTPDTPSARSSSRTEPKMFRSCAPDRHLVVGRSAEGRASAANSFARNRSRKIKVGLWLHGAVEQGPIRRSSGDGCQPSGERVAGAWKSVGGAS